MSFSPTFLFSILAGVVCTQSGQYTGQQEKIERGKTYLAIATALEQRRRAHQARIVVPQHGIRLSLLLTLIASDGRVRHAERILKDLEEVAAGGVDEDAPLAVVRDVACVQADVGGLGVEGEMLVVGGEGRLACGGGRGGAAS